MSAANIFAAIGAGLRTGANTVGALNEQERAEREREQARQDRLAEVAARTRIDQEQLELQRKNQASLDQERKARQLAAAIEGVAPDDLVDESVVQQIHDTAPELMTRIATNKTLSAKPITGSLENLQVGPAQGGTTTYTRKATLEEQGQKFRMSELQKQATAKGKFEAWMAGQGKSASYDDRVAMAAQFGVDAPPKTMKDIQGEKDYEHNLRMKELGVMYPPDRFGPDRTGAGGGNAQAKAWDLSYFKLADDVKALYMPQITALSKEAALAPDDKSIQAALAELQRHITEETDARATKLLGPRPGAPAGGPPAGNTPAGGDDPVERFMQDNAADIKANPKGVMDEVRNSPLPVDAKKAILARLMSVQPPPAAPAPPTSRPQAWGGGSVMPQGSMVPTQPPAQGSFDVLQWVKDQAAKKLQQFQNSGPDLSTYQWRNQR